MTSGDNLITQEVYDLLRTFLTDEETKNKIERINAVCKNSKGCWSFYPRRMYNQGTNFPDSVDYFPLIKSVLGDGYSERTLKYLDEHEKSIRLQKGEFFTSYLLVRELLQNTLPYLEVGQHFKVLEPCVGTGQFIDVLKYFFDDIDTCEINEGKDFLQYNTDKRYSLIIGNPPYTEDCTGYESNLKKGRYNMYALFIEKSITLLEPEGVISFILPPSIFFAPSFDKLRDYMNSNGLQLVYRRDETEFSNDVQQEVSLCIWKKHREIIEQPEEKHISLSDVAYVKTGTLVWNENKDKMTDIEEKDTNDNLLV